MGINGGYFPAICRVCLVFNSREAIVAIIGEIVVFFYNSKNLNCIGALCSFFKICSHIFQ